VDGQLELEIPAPAEEEPEPRTYWEHRAPRVWEPVTVRVRYATRTGPPPDLPDLPYVTCRGPAPRNVLVERADGTRDVRPVRLLRCKPPR
jgi:hypothetical protein